MIRLTFINNHKEIIRQYQMNSLMTNFYQRHLDKGSLVNDVHFRWDNPVRNLSYN